MKKLLLLFCCTPFLLASMCDDEDDTLPCSLEGVFGLNVQVIDEVTGETVLIAAVNISEGEYTDNLQVAPGTDPPTYVGAFERPGNYLLTVSRQGYETYMVQVEVLADECHVIPQTIVVALDPL